MLPLILYTLGPLALLWFAWRWANRFFNLPCPFWMDWLMETYYMKRVLGSEETVKRARIEAGHHVLDLGCGSGRISIPASKIVGSEGRVLAIDLQKGMISKLNQKLETEGITNIETRIADLDLPELTEDSFDRIIMVMLIGELKNPDSLFQKLRSILNPQGLVSVSEIFPDPHFQNRDRIISVAKKNNLEVVESFGSFLAFTLNLSLIKEN